MGQCWYTCILGMLLASTIMVMIVAGLLVGLSTWMLYDQQSFLVSFAEEQRSYKLALYLLLALGIILIFAGILSFTGALKKIRANLMAAFCIALVCITCQISLGIWIAVHTDRLKGLLKSNMIHTVKNEYGMIESRTNMVDAFQYELECCGVTGPADWAGSKYANKDPSLPFNLTVSSGVTNAYNVPESCCKQTDEFRNICNETRQLKIGGVVSSGIHDEGCMDKLLVELMRQTHIVGIIGIGIGLLEFLFAATSFLWKKAIENDYKA